MAGDRISEAYKGFIDETMRTNSRKRISWMCSQVTGNRILDIGCSQGILSILLGREGKNVVGIDNDFAAIEYANKDLEKESENVRENIKFIYDDFLQYQFKNKYTTIIIGEVLEHLFDPELFLEKASNLLDEEGTVLVSVPFGINAHPDHKRTYYFLELYKQIDKFFTVIDVHFMGKWIAMKAVNKNSKSAANKIEVDEKLIARIENAFYLLDEGHKNNKDYIKKLELEKKNLLNTISANKANLNDLIEKQKQVLSDLEQKYEHDKEILNDEATKTIEEYSKRLNYSQVQKNKFEKLYLDLKESKLGRLQVKYWRLRKNINRKKTEYYYSIKELAKKSATLRRLVQYYRDKTNNRYGRKNEFCGNPVLQESTSELSGLNVAQRRALFEERTDKSYFESIKNFLDQIPESNGGRFYDKHAYRIGIISDEFLYASFKDAAEFYFITPSNWNDVVDKTDFVIIVSTWKGLDEEWRGAAVEGTKNRNLIYSIIDSYKERNKITVFYSKEDPPNYSQFLGIAKKCDYIFTTCEEVVDNYKKDCENQKVDVVKFGVNPIYHNPIGIRNPYKKKDVVFSGSWMEKYPERSNDMRMLFDGTIEGKHSLKIIDRNYSYKSSEMYRFPQKYWEYISPEIGHTLLQKVHKLYDWAINVNTVTNSMTMFANRCYELQAAGNLLISNYSMGVNSCLPMVYTVINKLEVGSILDGYTDEQRYERQIASVRSVMTGETTFDRVGYIVDSIGFNRNKNDRLILVVANEIDEDIQEMFDLQSYPHKRLISIDEFTQDELEKSDMVTFFKNGMDYDVFYLEDMSNGFKYTSCSYITKDAYYDGDHLVEGKEHDYVSTIRNKSATIFWSQDFTAHQLKQIDNGATLENGYSIDHFNYNYIKQNNTKIQNPKISVIVPVYNNGVHLIGKAFSSLQRSTMFSEMEILLIDDGSTDGYTDKVVKYLEKNNFNVKAFLFEDGGSGSASRPRNKGVEIARAKYITFLDPDNEAVFDGYAKLYNLITQNKYDLVAGDMLKLTDKIHNMKYYKSVTEKYGSDMVKDDVMNYMVKTKFLPMSIQAMLINKSLIVKNNLKQPVGAAGEDTLFCWELFFNAKSVKIIDVPIHLYYASVDGSTVNSISKKFFERYYLIEKPRRDALIKYGALKSYMAERYSYYFENWVLKNLSKVKEDIEICTEIAYNMHKIYQDVYLHDNKKINKFIETCEKSGYEAAFALIKNSF